jgi:hypothetical protein
MKIIPLQSNIVKNASFEWDFDTSWQYSAGTTKDEVEVSQDRSWHGRNSLKLTGAETQGVEAKQFTEIDPNSVYYCIGHYWASPDAAYAGIGIKQYDSELKLLYGGVFEVESVSTTEEWVVFKKALTTSALARYGKAAIVQTSGFIYFDAIWIGKSTGEEYTFIDRPVYPFTRISRKNETQKRSLTNRATVFRMGDVKREFPFEFYATPRSQMEKLRSFFKEYPYYYLEPELSEEKKSYFTYWADTNFSFEELPGGAYFSGSMKLVEV